MQSIRCKQSKVDNVSYIISMFPVCGGLPVHLWHGRQGLPPESHLRDARVPSPWLRPCWRTPRSLPHVSHRVKQKCLQWFYSSTPPATPSWKSIEMSLQGRVALPTRRKCRSTSGPSWRGGGRGTASSSRGTAAGSTQNSFVKFLPQLFTAIQPFVCHQITLQVEQVFKGGTGDNFHQYAN